VERRREEAEENHYKLSRHDKVPNRNSDLEINENEIRY
jgi:hypothetical protein